MTWYGAVLTLIIACWSWMSRLQSELDGKKLTMAPAGWCDGRRAEQAAAAASGIVTVPESCRPRKASGRAGRHVRVGHPFRSSAGSSTRI